MSLRKATVLVSKYQFSVTVGFRLCLMIKHTSAMSKYISYKSKDFLFPKCLIMEEVVADTSLKKQTKKTKKHTHKKKKGEYLSYFIEKEKNM